jgi:hypothetical protein
MGPYSRLTIDALCPEDIKSVTGPYCRPIIASFLPDCPFGHKMFWHPCASSFWHFTKFPGFTYVS